MRAGGARGGEIRSEKARGVRDSGTVVDWTAECEGHLRFER